jgi:hypothetical protein
MPSVQEVAIGTYEEIRELELPEAFVVVTYQEILRARLAPASDVPAATAAGPVSHDSAPEEPATPASASSRAPAIQEQLGLSAAEVEELYSLSNDSVELVVSPGRLPRGAATATREITLLLCAARQAQGEEWTQISVVREAVAEYRRYDEANFARTIAAMEDELRLRGRGRSRELRLSRQGWDRARALASRVTEEA